MSHLTLEFTGVLDDILNALVGRGFAKTKAEAVRMALLRYGEERGLVEKSIHAKAEEYAYDEIKKRLNRVH